MATPQSAGNAGPASTPAPVTVQAGGVSSDATGQVERTAPPLAAVDFFREGRAFLAGSNGPQDFGLAAARLLDAADLKHPAALFYCALLYYCGVGVTRNVTTASDYASQYLTAQGGGVFAKECKAILDGSLGTENARKLLFQKSTAEAAPVSRIGSKRWLIAAAVAIPLLGAGTLIAIHFSEKLPDNLDAVGGLQIDQLISKAEIEEAQREALTRAAAVQADADIELQQLKAAAAQQEKADQERREQEAAAARQQQAEIAERERQRQTELAEREERRREAEETRRAAALEAQAWQTGQRQNTSMLATARDAIRQGQLDRANGILDAVLAASPGNADALMLKQHIQQVRARAISNLQIR